MISKGIVMSILVIGVVAMAAGAGTFAYFSDTEESTENTFTAGTLDLKVDWVESYNGEEIETQTETDDPGAIFNLGDVKPGDYGEVTISLHVYGNDAYGIMTIIPTSNDDVSSTEPELAEDDEEDPTDEWDGELAQNMDVVIWWDMYDEGGTDADNDGIVEYPGDNIQDETEFVFYDSGAPLETFERVLDADPFTIETIDPLEACTTYYIGINWSIDSGVGNIIQSDEFTANISFYTEQARHNTPPQG